MVLSTCLPHLAFSHDLTLAEYVFVRTIRLSSFYSVFNFLLTASYLVRACRGRSAETPGSGLWGFAGGSLLQPSESLPLLVTFKRLICVHPYFENYELNFLENPGKPRSLPALAIIALLVSQVSAICLSEDSRSSFLFL